MPFNPCNRKPIGQNCQNQMIALVLFGRVKIWFVFFILVCLQIHLFNSFLEKYAFCFSPCVLRMNVFVFRSHFQHNVASSSDTQSNWEECFEAAVFSFVPSKRYKMFWKCQRLLIRLIRVVFQVLFSEYFFLPFLHQFGSKILRNLLFLWQIWGFSLCNESFRARICPDFQLCFTFLQFQIWFPKLPVFHCKQVVNRHFFWNVTTKLIFGLVPCNGNQLYCSFPRLYVELFLLVAIE